MNWKLILSLSLFGLAMAFATVFWISTNIEPVFWLIIFSVCAYFIAKRCSEKYFLHGFFVSMVNCVWITCVHMYFLETYIMNHLDVALMMSGDMPMGIGPKLGMAVVGIFIGVLSGVVLGLFSFIASKFVKTAPINNVA